MVPSFHRSAAVLIVKCTAAVICIANSLVDVGWFADLHNLKNLIPGQPVVPANCSLAWTLAGAALFLLCTKLKPLRWFGMCLALVMIVLGVLTLYGGMVNQNLDWLVIQGIEDSIPVELPGQMLFQESIPFILIGCSMLLVEAQCKWLKRLAAFLTICAMLPAAQALFGYATANSELYTFCTANECARLHIFIAVVSILFSLTLLLKTRTTGAPNEIASQ